jgi:anti-sigma regulatory factor (Ser/Thr protein kinase)
MATGTAGPATVATPPRKREQVLAGRPDQVRVARAFLATVLADCPAADDAILCISELASNSVLHSASHRAGGTFTIRAEMHSHHARIEVTDNGGPWNEHPRHDARPHGLDIVRALAADWGRHGDPQTGWTVWARLEWARPRVTRHAPTTHADHLPAIHDTQEKQQP